MVDNISNCKKRIKREFCSFYTNSDPILDYMIAKVGVSDGDKILEPCAGDGVFIAKILETNEDKDFSLEAVDLNKKAITNLITAFETSKKVHIRNVDTLLDISFDLIANSGGGYTKIIGNPPYGAWQDYDKRKLLKKKYSDYAKETYTLFIHRSLDLLENNGRLVFIVPDTFLALNSHKHLRERILSTTVLEEIIIMPSKFFPGVKFGYSKLCIFSLRKSSNKKKIHMNKFRLIELRKRVEELYDILENKFDGVDVHNLKQEEILNTIDYSFLIGATNIERTLINQSNLRLGDLADCVTGFYSGDNKMFIKDKQSLTEKEIFNKTLDNTHLNGIDAEGDIYIPIYKGKGFIEKEKNTFVRWNKEIVNFYKADTKARFQNSKYYFRIGIGVPMVKSKKIEAFYINGALFDQSVVGIFPKQDKYIKYILGFLNSEIGNRLIQVINHTSNNSANYLKKLPIIIDESRVETVNNIIDKYFETKDKVNTQKELDLIFNSIFAN